ERCRRRRWEGRRTRAGARRTTRAASTTAATSTTTGRATGARLGAGFPWYSRASMKGITYRPDVDGLRAVAVTGVVIFHAWPGLLRGGFTGVDVFFVVSGFLITSLVAAELETGTFSFAQFY